MQALGVHVRRALRVHPVHAGRDRVHARCGELSARSWPQHVGLALALRLSLRVALRLLEYARHAQRV